MNKYGGRDNFGKLKSAYLMKIAVLTDKKLKEVVDFKKDEKNGYVSSCWRYG